MIGRWTLLVLGLAAGNATAQASAGDALRAQFASVRAQGTGRMADRPVYLLSTESPDRMQGDVYALVNRPFDAVRRVLSQAEDWCDILILHINTQYCRVLRQAAAVELVAGIGHKHEQPLSEVYWLRFDYRVVSTSEALLEVALQAPSGPLNTSDHRIAVEVAPMNPDQSILHLRYAYRYGLAGRWAMQAYLATTGRNKVGFTVVGQGSDGQPVHVAGVRGVLERNTVRYYLGIEAVLAAARLPAAARMPYSLQDWFGATQRYPLQLNDTDRDSYVQTKQRELQRQKTEPVPSATP